MNQPLFSTLFARPIPDFISFHAARWLRGERNQIGRIRFLMRVPDHPSQR
jgi:hypothetical protein